MQIPLTLPEQTTPLPSRRDIQALSPVSPVPGVEAQAKTLDPRLALQWTQPVLGDQSADLARSVLESVTTPTTPTTPLGASSVPAATPQAVAWSSLAQMLGPLLQRISDTTSTTGVPWPTAVEPLSTAHAPPSAQEGAAVQESLQALRTQLAQSDLFAAHHLARHWFKPPTDPAQAAPPSSEEMPDTATLSRWVSALSPDSDTAEHITRMLVNGRMQWQGELLPGIAVTLDREDAWREDPQHPGQAQKGASLRAQMDLPRLGRMTVMAYQWGEHLDLRVMLPSSHDGTLNAAWPVLEDRLSQLHLPDLRVERVETP